MPRAVKIEQHMIGEFPLTIYPPKKEWVSRNRHPLGDPYRIIEFKGQEIPLFTSRALRGVLAINWRTLNEKEKLNIIPQPTFVIKGRKYYTIWEMKILQELVLLYGRPTLSYKKNKGFIEEWHSLWRELRRMIHEGKAPDIPIWLRYNSIEDLKYDMAQALMQIGITSPQAAERVADFLAKQSMY